MLQTPPDLLVVIGGYNSSNTTHLAEMGEARLPTVFVKNGNKKLSASRMDRAWRQTTRLIHRGSLSTSPELVVQAPSSGLPRRRPTLQLTESETCLTQN